MFKAARRVALFFYIQIRLQVPHIFLKGLDTLRGNLTDGLRIVILELFRNIDITGFLKLIDLDAQVTGRSVGLLS